MLAFAALACNSAEVCAPGATQECVGAAACQGTQYCITSGAGYGPCECGGVLPDAAQLPDGPQQQPDASPPDAFISSYPDCPTCMHAQYVIGPQVSHGISIPLTTFQAQSLGCDLDGDGMADNQFGKVFAALAGVSSAMNLQIAADHAFVAGAIILLLDLEYTPAIANTSVAGMKMYAGMRDPGGSGNFIVTQSAGPGVGGQISNINQGQFGPGSAILDLPLAFNQPPFRLMLEDASLFGYFQPSYITGGKLCGAVRAIDVLGQMIPAWAAALSALVKAGGSDASMIKSLFDADHSCDTDPNCTSPMASGACTCITAQEVQSNSIINSLLRPDLDFDPMATNPFVTDPNDPTYRNDAISIGVGFEAGSATFMAP